MTGTSDHAVGRVTLGESGTGQRGAVVVAAVVVVVVNGIQDCAMYVQKVEVEAVVGMEATIAIIIEIAPPPAILSTNNDVHTISTYIFFFFLLYFLLYLFIYDVVRFCSLSVVCIFYLSLILFICQFVLFVSGFSLLANS